ncbi:MAG TPA: NAD-dependent epimerase/dehydratase family protein, partial [Thermoanaerobaculia bacterium]|nr:NAD-dependent epimerase/dehydratase family protein [Thermoanaerobaculia bacterium]
MELSEARVSPQLEAGVRTGAKTRVAVVGAGYVANFHLEVLAGMPEVQVVAVCDPDLDRARSAARQWNVPQAVGSVEELASSEVDVAHVLTPPNLHVPIARQLLELGIGVLVEKPLALSSAEARELQALADERGLPLGVNHNNVWHPAFARLLSHVRAGRIGRVEHVRVCLSVPLAQLEAGDFSHWMFRSPENIVFEQAPHPLSQLHALLGPVREATTTILSTRELHPGQLFHDRWLVAARGERATAEVYMAFGQGFNRWTLEVLGSDGSAEADLGHNLFSYEEKTPWLDFWNSFLAGVRRGRALAKDARAGLVRYARYTLGMGPREDTYFVGMRGSVRAFYSALRERRALPVDGAQAAEVLDWCEAIAAEAARGRTAPAPQPALPAPGPARPGEVVVLGGTGFIGRRVVQGLLERGMPVTTIVRRTHGLPPTILTAARSGRLRLLPGSLENREALRQAFDGARVVLHLATGGGDTWEKVERSMIRGSVAAAEEALARGVLRFVYVSSIAALYAGADCGTDVLEDSLETDPQPAGRDVYSRGKMAAEAALAALHRERGLPLVIVRPGVVLGEGTPFQHSGFGLWVRDNHCVGWGLGDNPLPVVTADDVADALVRLAAHEGHDLDGQALNLCSQAPLSAREIVSELRKATGRDLHFHPRPLWISQSMEIGKWLVKKAGRRPGVTFPSYRDLKSRALVPRFSSRTAREVLGWRPLEDREE